MKIDTKYCGEMTYEYDELIRFPDGLFGFESLHDFLLIRLEDDEASPFCLQCTEDPSLALILLDPFQLVNDYAPMLSDEDLARLGSEGDDLAFYVTCVLCEPVHESSVNLRCPIVLNVRTRTAFQLILSDALYDFRQKLGEIATKEDGVC